MDPKEVVPVTPTPVASVPVPAPSRVAAAKEKIGTWFQWAHTHPSKNTATLALGAILVLLIVLLVANGFGKGIAFLTPETNYVPVYTLVNDKVSQSGAIIVNLPKGVSQAAAAGAVTFDPPINGEWIASTLKEAVVYKPSQQLTIGKHYLVALSTEEGVIKKDFLVDEDPRVVDVFPSAEAEADPASTITIVFNRPMVPLTTLSELDALSVPVGITPQTQGRFKWISTRTLQFIPAQALAGSANYTVTIGNDFVSMDGLAVPGMVHSFTTKRLRLDHTTAGAIVYNEPINFYFNQPVDLERTAREIRVTEQGSGRAVDVVATHGHKMVYNQATGKNVKVEDTSIVSVLPKNSLNGHANVWQFDTAYNATIARAYTVGGDITLPEAGSEMAAQTSVLSGSVLREVTAQSEKSTMVSPALFDPSGSATFSFFEDIDIGKSTITGKGIRKITYGEKCKESDEDDYYSAACDKVPDESVLMMTFDAGAYARGEQVPVTFERLMNTAGYQVNQEPIVSTLAVYPEPRITKVTPGKGTTGASVKELVLCSNVPLKPQEAKEFYQSVKANNYLVFGRWDNAYLEGEMNYYGAVRHCAVGEYVNRISYGILPKKPYTLSASFEDVFSQKTSINTSFTTGDAPLFYLRFQNLQKIYNVTTPEHTKLTYATENFDYVDLSICKVSPDAMVQYLAAEPSEVSTKPNGAFACTSSVTERIQLKSDQWVNQYFQVDLKQYFPDPRGQYVMSFSHPQYVDAQGAALYGRTYVSVTNLAVTSKRVKWSSYDYTPEAPERTDMGTRGALYWVSQMQSLLPISGAQVKVYKAGATQTWGGNNPAVPPVLASVTSTNASGFGEFTLIPDVVGAAITQGAESAVVSAWADTLNSASWQSAHQEEMMYVYTDRPIYRPGQEVFIKGLYRLHFDGMFKIFSEADMKVEVRNSKGEVVLSQKRPVSAYGTFNTSVKLPADAPLGSYSISAGNGWASFDVAEYVGAAFETKAETDKEEYVAGETARVAISGKYYFGVPLDGGTLEYSLSAQNFYFDRYQDEFFSFGNAWYSCYDCGYGDTYLKSGKATLDAQGNARLEQSLDFAQLFKDENGDQSKIFVLHGTIKDKQGKSVSFQKSFIVHRGSVYLGVKTDPSFTGTNQNVSLRAKTVDVQGKPIAKSAITIAVNKVGWESYKRQEVDGGFYNRPAQTLTPVLTKQVSTNSSGEFTEQIKLAEPGQYQIVATTNDAKGNVVKGVGDLYVYGAGTVDVRPTNNATLNVRAEKTDVKVGEKAQFIIESPFPRAKALISIERGHIFTYEVVDITQSMYKYEFPITEEYSPNVYASVVLLAPGPAIKFGQVEFTIDRKSKELSIDIKADKTAYLPGEKVKLAIKTTDARGRAVPANVSLAVADLSVLALKGNPKKDPLLFFYNGFPLTVTTEANVKNLLMEAEIPTGNKGGDGGNPADLATRKRGEFKDTAFWQADVETNAQGVAEVSFTLPDNITRWQIESLGVTKDTQLGVRYQDILAQKEVMAVPLKPRFIVPGDTFMLGVKVFNQSANTQTLDIAIESSTLAFEGTQKARKTIKAGESDVVYVEVTAPESYTEGVHQFTVSAKNGSYNDTVEQSISITRNMTYESTATANSTSAVSAKEYLYLPDGLLKDRGGLTIKTSATLAVYLTDALTYLFEYPYGCSEQLASRLSAMAITKKALAVPNVGESFTFPKVLFGGASYTVDEAITKGLQQIYDSQNADGGFAYYKGLKADPYVSIHVLNTLMDIKSAGYPVRQQAITDAVAYLYGQVSYFRKQQGNTDTLILLTYALSRADVGSGNYAALVQQVIGLSTARYLSDSASSNSLAYLALISTRAGVSPSFKEKVFAALINRVEIDSRGAYVKPNPQNIGWAYYETTEKNTALFLKALATDKRAYTQTDSILRWLVASRASDGAWGSTNASVAAIDALSEYLLWKRETESNFTLTTTLDEGTISETTFSAENILSTITTFLPINDLKTNAAQALAFTKSKASELPNNFYYDLSLKYFLPVKQIAPRDEGVAITRAFYQLTDTAQAQPLTSAKVGEVVHGVLTIISPKERTLFAIEDYIPAGFELVDFSLDTEDQATITGGVGMGETETMARVSVPTQSMTARMVMSARRMMAAAGLFGEKDAAVPALAAAAIYTPFRPDFEELHDDRLFLFAQNLAPGAYTYHYYVRATTPGTFSHLPAVASDLYFPENFGRTAGSTFTVEQ